jgi:hypothetical protein
VTLWLVIYNDSVMAVDADDEEAAITEAVQEQPFSEFTFTPGDEFLVVAVSAARRFRWELREASA